MTVTAMTTSDGALTSPAETAVSPMTRPPTMPTELPSGFGTRSPIGHFGRLACHGGAPGNAVQIEPDIVRRTVYIAVLCRKAAQLIQRLFAHKGAQSGKADFDPLLLALQKRFVQLLLLGQNELFRAELGPHLRDNKNFTRMCV